MAKIIVSRSTVNILMATTGAQQNEILSAMGSKSFHSVAIPASMEVKGFKNFSVTDDGSEVVVEINDKLVFAIVAISNKYNSLVALIIKTLMALGIGDKIKDIMSETQSFSKLLLEQEEQTQINEDQ